MYNFPVYAWTAPVFSSTCSTRRLSYWVLSNEIILSFHKYHTYIFYLFTADSRRAKIILLRIRGTKYDGRSSSLIFRREAVIYWKCCLCNCRRNRNGFCLLHWVWWHLRRRIFSIRKQGACTDIKWHISQWCVLCFEGSCSSDTFDSFDDWCNCEGTHSTVFYLNQAIETETVVGSSSAAHYHHSLNSLTANNSHHVGSTTNTNMPKSYVEEEDMVPTVFRWEHGGRQVYITGTFNDWSRQIPMHRSGNDFTYIHNLRKGKHAFKFIVDEIDTLKIICSMEHQVVFTPPPRRRLQSRRKVEVVLPIPRPPTKTKRKRRLSTLPP